MYILSFGEISLRDHMHK